jgi:hypothetical protein
MAYRFWRTGTRSYRCYLPNWEQLALDYKQLLVKHGSAKSTIAADLLRLILGLRFTEACSGSLAPGTKSVRVDAAFSPQLASR